MNEKLDARTKWTYCIGATGRDAAYALVSMYLILYVQYTMNLTSAQFAVISGAMIALYGMGCQSMICLMGIIIENTHFKMGKFKPWILIGCISKCDRYRMFVYHKTKWMGICGFLQSVIFIMGNDLYNE